MMMIMVICVLIQGDTGPDGAAGKPGRNGINVSIYLLLYVYVSRTYQLVLTCSSPQGTSGPSGIAGQPGPAGPAVS